MVLVKLTGRVPLEYGSSTDMLFEDLSISAMENKEYRMKKRKNASVGDGNSMVFNHANGVKFRTPGE